MTNFFTFLETHRNGILLTLLCLAFVAFIVQWFAWIFSKGRFWRGGDAPASNAASAQKQNLRYIISDAIIKIVNDFRHLLALVIIGIFAVALCFTLFQTSPNLENMKEALQAVVATLGGLVGSIIGYYFGESAVIKAREAENATDPAKGTITMGPAFQLESAPITDAPEPPPAAMPPAPADN